MTRWSILATERGRWRTAQPHFQIPKSLELANNLMFDQSAPMENPELDALETVSTKEVTHHVLFYDDYKA